VVSYPQCLDHVVPRVQQGCNSYRNLVSSGIECNSQKGERAADDFLRRLYREGHLNASELTGRLRALDDLASGKLRPSLPALAKPTANQKIEIRKKDERKTPHFDPKKSG